MTWLYRLASVLGWLVHPKRAEQKLDDELQAFLEISAAEKVRAGLPPEHARRLAMLELGGIEQARERVRTYRHGAWLEEIGRDVRYGVRLAVRTPGFTGIIVLTLALGIGANTAIFSVIDAVRLRSLPVRAPDELYAVRIGSHGPSGNFTSRYSDLSYAQWEQIELRQQAFTSIAAWSPRQFNLAGGGERRPAEGILVSGRFFEMLGVPASRGRVLAPDDDGSGCGSPAAVISYAFWQRAFGGDGATVGARLRVDGHPFTIVGITPERFLGVEVGRSYDIAIPLCAEALLAGPDSQLTARRHNYWLSVMGRLADGRTISRRTGICAWSRRRCSPKPCRRTSRLATTDGNTPRCGCTRCPRERDSPRG